jgi:beta-lactamase regulating signal transducer with metallopeptidase domain
MNPLLEAAIKISLVIALGLLAAWLMRRRSAALRHWMLASAIAVALATPLLMGLAPSWTLPVIALANSSQSRPPAPTPSTPSRIGITTTFQNESTTTAPAEGVIAPAIVPLTIWLVGVVVNLAGLLWGFWRLHRTAARATVVREGLWLDTARQLSDRLDVRAPVRLLQSDRPAVLVTWGLFSPKVLLPIDAPSWDADRIRVVLAHELAHVQRRDWAVQMGGELLRIACWFNPLVWLAASRMRLESERACDDAVVNLGVSGREYALHLLELARQFGRARDIYPAVAIVPRPSSLERRVTAMLNPRLSRRPLSVTTRLGTIAALLVIALPIALFAQARFSTLTGSVTDPSGGLLPGVTVVAVDTTRDARHEVKTNRSGEFEIIGLPDGPLVLEATLPGFQKFQQKLTLDGQDVNRSITLRVGSLQETITVTRGGVPPSFEGRRFSPKPADCNAAAAGRGGAATGMLRIGGQIRQPAKIRHVSPVYPEGSSSGVVILEAVIGPDGLVSDSTVLRTPAPALALAAENAVRQWEFTPTLLNCVPVPVIMTVTVDFN